MQQPPQVDFKVAEPQQLAYSINEATKVAKVGRNTLHLAVNSGALRARKLGKKTLILPEDLQRWLEALPDFTPARSPGPRVAPVAAE
jgi:excisionase family DNA binding protein